jgi:hypothetical protein
VDADPNSIMIVLTLIITLVVKTDSILTILAVDLGMISTLITLAADPEMISTLITLAADPEMISTLIILAAVDILDTAAKTLSCTLSNLHCINHYLLAIVRC